MTFGKRSLFIYKCLTELTGLFIRRTNWVKIIKDPEYDDLVGDFKKNIKYLYEKNVKNPMFAAKKRKIESYA